MLEMYISVNVDMYLYHSSGQSGRRNSELVGVLHNNAAMKCRTTVKSCTQFWLLSLRYSGWMQYASWMLTSAATDTLYIVYIANKTFRVHIISFSLRDLQYENTIYLWGKCMNGNECYIADMQFHIVRCALCCSRLCHVDIGQCVG